MNNENAPVMVIVGGSGGIGSAVAHRLAAKNYRLVLAARDPERLHAVAGQTNAQTIPLDARDSAAGVPAIDTLYVDFKDEAGLAAACRTSRRRGFRGRVAIHPDQSAIINAAYAPTSEELAHAQRIVAAVLLMADASLTGRCTRAALNAIFSGDAVDLLRSNHPAPPRGT